LDDFIISKGFIWTLWSDKVSYSIIYGKLFDNSDVYPLMAPWVEVHTLFKDIAFPNVNEDMNIPKIEEYLLTQLLNSSLFSLKTIHHALSEPISKNYSNEVLRVKILENVSSLVEIDKNGRYIEAWKTVWKNCTKIQMLESFPVGFSLYSDQTIGCIHLVYKIKINFSVWNNIAQTLHSN
jgi:hypothetical protein